MTSVLVGTVKSVDLEKVVVADHLTSKEISCKMQGDDNLDIKEGETAIFVGTLLNGIMHVKKYEIRKFLDPLYEQDLFEIAGRYTIISVVDNPFAEIYNELTKST